jgi:hypothetical protein
MQWVKNKRPHFPKEVWPDFVYSGDVLVVVMQGICGCHNERYTCSASNRHPLKVPGSPYYATLMTDNQTEMLSLVVLYSNVGILRRNHLCLLARKRSLR